MEITIKLGLFAEGSTDYCFFLPIIERVSKRFVQQHPPEPGNRIRFIYPREDQRLAYSKEDKTYKERLVAVAKQAYERGTHLLLVHSDADAPSHEKTMQKKIAPAFKVVQTDPSDALCKQLVAILPIYETEAWMLADKEALKQAINTGKGNQEPHLPKRPETVSQPKEKFQKIIRRAHEHRSKRQPDKIKRNYSPLYTALGKHIDLAKLAQLRAFPTFEKAFHKALASLIQPYTPPL